MFKFKKKLTNFFTFMQATKQFASCEKELKNRVIDFNFNILLPRVRDDIAQFKRLNSFLHDVRMF